MNLVAFASATLGLVGLAFIALAVSRIRRRRFTAAGAHGMAGCCAVLLGTGLVAVALNLHTYQRLTYERTIADLTFRQFEPRAFGVTLNTDDGSDPRRFVLRGDEWQIDARVLKWHGFANLLGLDSHYRLERLSGRFADLATERSGPRTVFTLARPAGLDLWDIAHRHERWIPLVDAIYGSAAYLPMANGARFEVSITQSGLIARPANRAAERATAAWR